ncbi:lipoyl(octanoyl) transferase LipB [Desulfovibrio sp. OttesenSCG-928-F20]|nr:lipoyl(octanoyl) transferase LipB [Desulfovibrio sp. OttesenSCG-928-F20]
MIVRDLGLIDYEEAVALQEEAADALRRGGQATLFLLEHPPVITFGRNGGEENLPLGRAFFAERGVSLVSSSRGGNITCHFPGQLVAYPILRVDRQPGGLRAFFHNLEEAVISTLAVCGIQAERSKGRPGVWLGNRKICSIGIAVKHWITSHGLALNVAKDLSLFNMVSPCGLSGVSATSIHRELGDESLSMQEVKTLFTNEFLRLFEGRP